MFLFSRTFTRQAITVPFHYEVLDGKAFSAHMTAAYINTGKLVNESKTISEDQLTFTYASSWQNKEVFDEYNNDPALVPYWTERDVYCANNNIVIGPAVTEQT